MQVTNSEKYGLILILMQLLLWDHQAMDNF